MCRYATPYKEHYACFECRKTIKRRLMRDIDRNKNAEPLKDARCPDCGRLMADMGKDFKSPLKKDVKAWSHLKGLYAAGITFHSCGRSGPGLVAATKQDLKKYIDIRLNTYIASLRYWMNLEADAVSKNSKISNEDFSQHYKIPAQLKNKDTIEKEKAVRYWTAKIKEIETLKATL